MTVTRGACLRSKTDLNDEPFVVNVDMNAATTHQVRYVLEDGTTHCMSMADARASYDVVDVMDEQLTRETLDALKGE